MGIIFLKYELGDWVWVYYIRKGLDWLINVIFGSCFEVVYKEVDKCDEFFFGVFGDYFWSWNKGVFV